MLRLRQGALPVSLSVDAAGFARIPRPGLVSPAGRADIGHHSGLGAVVAAGPAGNRYRREGLMDLIAVYFSVPLRTHGVLPVRPHLRPCCPLYTSNDFCPVFMRLVRPADRSTWRYYDFIEAMPLDDALAWPCAGEC
jgi:hypothetical protein